MKKILVGFTVLGLLALVAVPALAGGHGHGGSDDVTVTNDKKAVVLNHVTVTADTGGNSADGGEAGDGGNGGEGGVGGKVNIGNDNNDGGSADGGNGGIAGDVTTGNADASGKVVNIVNTDITDIDCDCVDNGDIKVKNKDRAFVGNYLDVEADTGGNSADGGEAGDGGNGGEGGVGGKVNIGNDGNDGGSADGGKGGEGWSVSTGSSTSRGKVFNLVNTVITRIR